jgi:hypothetical protein
MNQDRLSFVALAREGRWAMDGPERRDRVESVVEGEILDGVQHRVG